MNYADTVAALVAYYADLLIGQYRTKPKARATVAAFTAGADGQHGLLGNVLALQVRAAFDLDTAVGKQLDILGKYIGASRYFFGLDLNKSFLQVIDYDDPNPGAAVGMADYDAVVQPPSWYTMTYDDFVENTLTDDEYRRVLHFLAAVKNSDYAYGTLDSICYTFFFANVNLKVTGNMAYTYQHLTSDGDNLFSIIKQMGLLPAPAGVTVTAQEVASF